MAPLPSFVLHTATHHTVPLSLFAIAAIIFFLVCFYFSLPDTAKHEATHMHHWSPYANTWTMGFLSPQHSSGTPQSTELRCYKQPCYFGLAGKNPHTFGALVSAYDASLSEEKRPGERQIRGETVTLQDAWRGEECLEIGVGFSNVDLEGGTVVGDDGSHEDGGRREMTEPFPEYIDQFAEYVEQFPEYDDQFPEYDDQFPEYDGQFLALEEERKRVEREDMEIEGNDVRLYEEKWRKWRDEKGPHTNLSPLSGCVF